MLALAICGLAISGCKQRDTAPPPEPTPSKPASLEMDSAKVTRGREAIAALRRGLMQALMGALPKGGPVSAIAVCKEEAPRIAAAVQRREGVEVGRTSHKLRNPANAPRAWVKPLLRAYTAKTGDTAPWRAVPLGEGAVGIVEPIVVMGPCLRCHGGDLAPEIRARLKQDYPSDRATGFAAGDLRGLFWAEVR